MNHFRYIFAGFLLTFASAWLGLAIIPSLYYAREAAKLPAQVPSPESAAILRGEEQYARGGCVYCHTQQVRSPHFGSDVARLWGQRRTVAADYLRDSKAMMGTMRTGPDLSDIGERMASATWHYQHLYEPRSLVADSTMPPYYHLFERKPLRGGVPDPDAVILNERGERIDAQGMQRVPTSECRDLVAYLLSLKRTLVPRPEALEAPVGANTQPTRRPP